MATTQMFQVSADKGGHTSLVCTEEPLPALGPNDVLLNVKSISLNYRDLMLTGMSKKGMVPCSDGMGTVAAVGSSVSRVKVGDRVCSLFFAESWIGGDKPPSYGAALGSDDVRGMLATNKILNEGAVSKFAEHLTDEEAATLPCAGLTAWDSLVNKGKIKAGDWVLCEGTGGVSTWGIVFAKAFGAKAVVTSSSNAKLDEAKKLGADVCINYKETPEWGAKVKELTGGHGCDQILEVAGEWRQALECLAPNGTVSMIGSVGKVISGLPEPEKVARKAAIGNPTVKTDQVFVGSRASFEAMCVKLTETKLRPVVGERVAFENSPKAFQIMESQKFFGNVNININSGAKL